MKVPHDERGLGARQKNQKNYGNACGKTYSIVYSFFFLVSSCFFNLNMLFITF